MAFLTRKFVASHGKRPGGRGCWAFCLADDYDKPNYLDYVRFYTGLYSNAKALASRDFPKGSVVVVCP